MAFCKIMKCVTDSEISTWLKERSLVAKPYEVENEISHCIQFKAPNTPESLDLFLSTFFGLLNTKSELCMDIADWDCYADKMIGFKSVRSIGGEHRDLIDATGHIFEPCDLVVTELFKLCSLFGWSSYIYSDLDQTTLHCWEGELYDFWTDSEAILQSMLSLIGDLGFERTS